MPKRLIGMEQVSQLRAEAEEAGVARIKRQLAAVMKIRAIA